MSQPRSNPGYRDIAYLQAFARHVADLKQRSYELMNLQSGQIVLDVGCGPATDTVPLAQIVGPGGQVVGVDYDAEMIAAAREKAEAAGVSAWVRHEQVDATLMPFEANTFDACRSERTFQHLPDPDRVMAEMVRVTKPGGWIVVADTDLSSLSIDSPLLDTEWKLRRFRADRRLNGYSGRRLYGQFQRQNLQDIRLEVFPSHHTDAAEVNYFSRAEQTEQSAVDNGIITADELQRWRADQERATRDGVYFAYVNMLMLAGRKS